MVIHSSCMIRSEIRRFALDRVTFACLTCTAVEVGGLNEAGRTKLFYLQVGDSANWIEVDTSGIASCGSSDFSDQ